MPGGRRSAPSAPCVERADLVVPGEPVLADHIQPIREIKLVGMAPAVQVDVPPVVGFEPVEGVPQPRVGGDYTTGSSTSFQPSALWTLPGRSAQRSRSPN